MIRPMIHTAALLVAASSAALPASASSDDAWKEFVADVQTACLAAAGDMIDDAKEAIQEAYFRAGDEVRGLATGFLRRVIAGRRASQQARLGP